MMKFCFPYKFEILPFGVGIVVFLLLLIGYVIYNKHKSEKIGITISETAGYFLNILSVFIVLYVYAIIVAWILSAFPDEWEIAAAVGGPLILYLLLYLCGRFVRRPLRKQEIYVYEATLEKTFYWSLLIGCVYTFGMAVTSYKAGDKQIEHWLCFVQFLLLFVTSVLQASKVYEKGATRRNWKEYLDFPKLWRNMKQGMGLGLAAVAVYLFVMSWLNDVNDSFSLSLGILFIPGAGFVLYIISSLISRILRKRSV